MAPTASFEEYDKDTTPRSGGLGAMLLTIIVLSHFIGVDLLHRLEGSKTLFGVTLGATFCSAVSGAMMVPLLRLMKFGQIVRTNGPQSHLDKQGTPTMGGAFLIPVGVVGAAVASLLDPRALLLACGTAAYAILGAWDDWKIITNHSSAGLPPVVKLLFQVLLGTLFWGAARLMGLLPANGVVWLTGSVQVALPPAAYGALSVFTFVALPNGVNLTDGLDGLAAGTCALAFLGAAAVLYPLHFKLAAAAAALAGACCGFLAHNSHPANVFMGDTGSMALGAALAALGVLSGMFGPLLVCCSVFVVESLSVIAQVAYYKCTKGPNKHGKRLFLMAPLHHHYELTGMHETVVTTRFYLMGLLAAYMAAYAMRVGL